MMLQPELLEDEHEKQIYYLDDLNVLRYEL